MLSASVWEPVNFVDKQMVCAELKKTYEMDIPRRNFSDKISLILVQVVYSYVNKTGKTLPACFPNKGTFFVVVTEICLSF